MFKARIKLLVLKELMRKEHSGYDLLKLVSIANEKKASPGYLYPLLHQLKKAHLVSSRKEGRKTIYTITAKGEKVLIQLSQSHQNMVHTIMKNLEPVSDKKEIGHLNAFHADMEKHRDKILDDMDIMHKFRQVLFSIYEKGYAKKRKAMRKILATATKNLEDLASR